MKYELIIFDMDGTILNTLDDLKNSTNYALSLHGLPCRSLEEIRTFVGNGIRLLIERAVPQNTPLSVTDSVYADFMEHYQQHCADCTRPYEGIVSLLQALKDRGYLTAVVSNKADPAVQELCRQYFDGLFDCAVGEQKGIAKKPAPDMVRLVLQKLNIPAEKAVYVGDSEVDIQTARNAALDEIIVEWGFRDEAFLRKQGAVTLVCAPEEILTLLDN
jgi:phosphoglycolate phosphatase